MHSRVTVVRISKFSPQIFETYFNKTYSPLLPSEPKFYSDFQLKSEQEATFSKKLI